jgi:hypothetical protein
MRKLLFIVLAASALFVVRPAGVAAQTVDDLKGVWVGQIVAGQSSQEAWLFLGGDEKGVKGTFTSNMNTSNEDAPLENVVFKDGVLTCEFVDRSPAARGRIFLELRISQGWLTGTFRDSAGGSGTLQVNRRIAPGPAPKPEDDLVGTWTGEMVAGKTRTKARLVLSRGEDGLAGQMTPDVVDVMTDFDLDHVVFKDETLTCEYLDERALKPVRVALVLKLTGLTTLEGTFRDASGKTGTITLTLETEAPPSVR